MPTHLKTSASTLLLLCMVVLGCKNRAEKSAVAFVLQWGGEGTEGGQFTQPIGIAFDRRGQIYVADAGNNRVQKFALVE